MFNPLSNSDTLPKQSIRSLEIQLARSKDDLNQAFGLTYRSYHRAGLAVDNPSGLRLTPYHLLPDSEVIVAKLDQTIVSTLSLFGDGELGLPMQSMYAREVEALRNQGLRLGEVGCLADRRASPSRFIATFGKMGRMLAQVATARNINTLIAAVHPKHAKLYKRVFGFQQIGGQTDCPYANGNPAEALFLRLDRLSPQIHDRFLGDKLPLEHLVPYHWDADTRNYFDRVLKSDGKIANTVGIVGYFDWGSSPDEAPVDLNSALELPGS